MFFVSVGDKRDSAIAIALSLGSLCVRAATFAKRISCAIRLRSFEFYLTVSWRTWGHLNSCQPPDRVKAMVDAVYDNNFLTARQVHFELQ